MENAYALNSAELRIEGWDIPSAYARSAALAGCRSSEIGEMAARAADVPAFADLLEQTCLVEPAKAGHIRRFGNIPALKTRRGANPIGV
jgi:hypothetical protein